MHENIFARPGIDPDHAVHIGSATLAGGFTHSDSILLNEIKRETDPLKIRNLTINLMLLSDDKAPLPLMEEAKQIDLLADQKRYLSEDLRHEYVWAGISTGR